MPNRLAARILEPVVLAIEKYMMPVSPPLGWVRVNMQRHTRYFIYGDGFGAHLCLVSSRT
jgi:hypothetical protein